jgi:hypothetical protein
LLMSCWKPNERRTTSPPAVPERRPAVGAASKLVVSAVSKLSWKRMVWPKSGVDPRIKGNRKRFIFWCRLEDCDNRSKSTSQHDISPVIGF